MMADNSKLGKPEIDDGHTKIANELLDAIIHFDFSKRQLKILLFIMRKTYGWNKLVDDISRSQIADATNFKSPHITTTIKELLDMNVIIISDGVYAKKYQINKYYNEWKMTETVKKITETVTEEITETVIKGYQNGNNSLPKQYPQKTTPKDNTKDNIAKVKKESQITIIQYLENCRIKNISALPNDCAGLKSMDALQIPELWQRLAWNEFKLRHIENQKKQSNWVSTFNTYIKNDWLKLWATNKDGEHYLTQSGKTCMALFEKELRDKKNG